MKIQAAILCDFAQVREGLLSVVSGGINRLLRPEEPGPLSVFLAIVLELDYEEIELVHEVRVVVNKDGGGQEMGRVVGAIQGPPGSSAVLNPGEPAIVPLALALHPIMLPGHGMYDVRISVDAEVPEIRTVYVAEGPAGPPT